MSKFKVSFCHYSSPCKPQINHPTIRNHQPNQWHKIKKKKNKTNKALARSHTAQNSFRIQINTKLTQFVSSIERKCVPHCERQKKKSLCISTLNGHPTKKRSTFSSFFFASKHIASVVSAIQKVTA